LSLEALILRHAIGDELPDLQRADTAVGVMMIPIPKAGILRGCSGIEAALAVPGVTGVEITAKLNYPIIPLPEGSAYLGFIFAMGDTPEHVEGAIRDAHSRLAFRIDAVLPVLESYSNP
jgi:hypothetical protein